MSIDDRLTRSIGPPYLNYLDRSLRMPSMSLRRRLVENVFGPFDANKVLDEYVTHRKSTPVDLHRLEVVRNGRPSG